MILFLFFLVLIIGLVVLWTIKNGIGPTPTSLNAKNLLMRRLPINVHGVIIEAGSGFGTLAFPLAKAYPNHTVIGYENSFVPYLISRIILFVFPQKNLSFVCADFWHKPFNDAGLVVCDLYPGAMTKMKEKCERELTPGTWVISNTFAIPGWEPLEIYEVMDIYRTKIFVYQTTTPSSTSF